MFHAVLGLGRWLCSGGGGIGGSAYSSLCPIQHARDTIATRDATRTYHVYK